MSGSDLDKLLSQTYDFSQSPKVIFNIFMENFSDYKPIDQTAELVIKDAGNAEKVKPLLYLAAVLFKVASKVSAFNLPAKFTADMAGDGAEVLAIATELLSSYKDETTENMQKILSTVNQTTKSDYGVPLTNEKGEYNNQLTELMLMYYCFFDIYYLLLTYMIITGSKSLEKVKTIQARKVLEAFRKISNKFKKNTGTESAADLNFNDPKETPAELLEQENREVTEETLSEVQQQQKATIVKMEEMNKLAEQNATSAAAEVEESTPAYSKYAERQRRAMAAITEHQSSQINKKDYQNAGYNDGQNEKGRLKELMENIAAKNQESYNSQRDKVQQQAKQEAQQMIQNDEVKHSDQSSNRQAEIKNNQKQNYDKLTRQTIKNLKNELKKIKKNEKEQRGNKTRLVDDVSFWDHSTSDEEMKYAGSTESLKAKLKVKAAVSNSSNEKIDQRKPALKNGKRLPHAQSRNGKSQHRNFSGVKRSQTKSSRSVKQRPVNFHGIHKKVYNKDNK